VNFMGDEGGARVRDAYPGSTWERLAAIKAHYDPTNLFRLNHNIPPEIKSASSEVQPNLATVRGDTTDGDGARHERAS
jgi:hypothetical protein